MNIVTFKFDVGDEVYLTNENKICIAVITRIVYHKNFNGEGLDYLVTSRKFKESFISVGENEIFKTKEDLFRHLEK